MIARVDTSGSHYPLSFPPPIKAFEGGLFAGMTKWTVVPAKGEPILTLDTRTMDSRLRGNDECEVVGMMMWGRWK